MSANVKKENKKWRWWFAAWLAVAVVVFCYALPHAHFSTAFVVASLIANAIILTIHLYWIKHPSRNLEWLWVVFFVVGFMAIQARIPVVGKWEAIAYFAFAIILCLGANLLVGFQPKPTNL
jgi:multidrug transporter EmrE-like cation transporter